MEQKMVVYGTRVPAEIKQAYEKMAKEVGLSPSEFLRNFLISNLSFARLKLITDDLHNKLDHLVNVIENNSQVLEKRLLENDLKLETNLSQLINENSFPKHIEEFVTTLFFLEAIRHKNMPRTFDFEKREVEGKQLFDKVNEDAQQAVKKRRSSRSEAK